MSAPRIIKTDADYQSALAEVDTLLSRPPRLGSADGDRLELLVLLISHYEDKHYPIPNVDPIDLIRFAIADMGRSQNDLADLLGSRPRASEVLNRKRALTLDMIRRISEAWKLPFEALAAPYSLAPGSGPAARHKAYA